MSGLAKLEGEVVEVGDNCQTNVETTKYELTGIVVHSGQASGGHYFSYILSKCVPVYMVNLLVGALKTLVPQYESTCAEFFSVLCRTLSYGCIYNWPLQISEGLLGDEIKWLQRIRENVHATGDTQVHEELLEGHLCLAKELMFFLGADSKAQLNELIHELIDDFLFTASREFLHLRRHGSLRQDTVPPPVCRSPHTIAAACDLLIALCQLCVPNMKLLTNTLIDFVCTGECWNRKIIS